MSEDQNYVALTGQIAGEPRFHDFGNGRVCNMRVRMEDEKGRQTYVTVSGWYEVADEMKNTREGERIQVDGSLRLGKAWTGRDGKERPATLEVQANSFRVIGNGAAEPVERYVDTEKIKFS